MKFLISWSGKQSHAVALAIRDWFPEVIPHAQPWMSSQDISPGSRWFVDLMSQLEDVTFCVICLTPDNVRSPWLYFEAGAIAAKNSQAKVCGLLTGISASQLGPGPLSHFQAVDSTAEGMWSLVAAINRELAEKSHDETLLKTSFSTKWPKLREQLKEALLLYDPTVSNSKIETDQPRSQYRLSEEAKKLLLEAALDPNGTVIMTRTMDGLIIHVNGKQLAERKNPRSEAKWQAAVRDLLHQRLLEGRGKGEVLTVTAEGYRAADDLKAAESTQGEPPEVHE